MHIVIIGSGIAGITFAEKMRTLNQDAEITVLTKETDGYYSRPILSHGFSKPDIEQTIIMKTFAQLRGVAIFAKACFGHPSPSKRQKLNATANAFGAPDVLRTCHFATTIVNSALAS